MCTDQLPVGVCAAELNYVLRMRLEANDPHVLGSVDHRKYLLLWPQCFFQPKSAFTQQSGRITTGTGRDRRPCPYPCAAAVPLSCDTRAGEKGKSPNSGAAAAPAAWQPFCQRL